MQAIFKRPGKTRLYTPDTAVDAGTVVVIGETVGIAERDIAASVQGDVAVAGIFAVVKAAETWTDGDAIYWDADGNPYGGTAGSGCATKTGTGNTPMGRAEGASGSTASTGNVLLVPNIKLTAGESTLGDILEGCDYQGTREQSATQNYALGTKRVYVDGRVFRYVKARTALEPEFGAGYAAKTITNAVAPTQGTGIGTVGSLYVKVTVGASDGLAGDGAIAANELVGGYIVIGNGTSQHPQNRRIVANTVVAAGGGTTTITLDEELDQAVTASTTNIETLMNPWILSDGYVTNSAYITFRGMPARRITVNYYGWIQTAGPCWITSDGNTCDSAGDRQVYFVANGSCVSGNDVTGDVNVLQLAGHAIDMSGSGASNAPFVNLCLETT